MKRAAIGLIAAALLAALAPATSGAVPNGYHGETDVGGLIAFRVKYNGKGEPTRVRSLRWANIPASCAGYSPTAHSGDLKISIKVDKHGGFEGSGKVPTGARVSFDGRFKHDFKKSAGHFRLKGTISGCLNADTGKLGWEMTRK